MPSAKERSTTQAIESMGMPDPGPLKRTFNGKRFRLTASTTKKSSAQAMAKDIMRRGGKARITGSTGNWEVWVHGTVRKLSSGELTRRKSFGKVGRFGGM